MSLIVPQQPAARYVSAADRHRTTGRGAAPCICRRCSHLEGAGVGGDLGADDNFALAAPPLVLQAFGIGIEEVFAEQLPPGGIAVELDALESEELRHDGLDDVDLAAGEGLAHELFGGGEIGFAGGEFFVADHLADMFVTIDDLPHPEPTYGLGGGFVDDTQYGGEGVLGFLRLLLQIEFGVVLDRELIDQGLGFLEGRCPQAELYFSLRGIQVLDVQGKSGRESNRRYRACEAVSVVPRYRPS